MALYGKCSIFPAASAKYIRTIYICHLRTGNTLEIPLKYERK